jgi:CheY-like chemotaxis protein
MEFEAIIVDDDEILLYLHKRILKVTGFHLAPYTFNQSEKALEFLDHLKSQGKPVVLFLDINMPILNGWDILDHIHQENYNLNIYVVLSTSSVNAVDKIKAKTYPKLIAFIEKPITEESIVEIKKKLVWF